MTITHRLIALAVILIWGINFLFMRLALNEVSPLILGILRFTFVLLPAIFFFPKPQVSWRWLILYGLTISFGQFAFGFSALASGLPTAISALLMQSQAFFTVLLAALLLGEPLRKHHFIGMGLAFLGLAIVGIGQFQGVMPLMGVWLALLAAASWALGNLTVKRIGAVNPVALVVWGNVSAWVGFVVAALWWHGGEHIMHELSALSLKGWGSVLYLSWVSSLLGYGGWGLLLSHYPASKVSPLSLLVPVVALLAGYFILREPLNAWHLVGGSIIMAALCVHVLLGKR
ncbi:MAG: EamA family transporter [Cardiobacteriaceae bacterium]|nr:EamA family transporter [Cardiobacteriaceae bacterium]